MVISNQAAAKLTMEKVGAGMEIMWKTQFNEKQANDTRGKSTTCVRCVGMSRGYVINAGKYHENSAI